jgi:DNA-binding IclR family transcriptional regulator
VDSNGASSRHDNDELDPLVANIMLNLWDASREPAGKSWSLAKLSKRTQLPMSGLRRTLTQLEAAGLVRVTMHDDGTGTAELTAEGLELGTVLFGQ